MNQPQTIIVYRSRGEQLQDEFIQEHPEAILWFLGFIVVATSWAIYLALRVIFGII